MRGWLEWLGRGLRKRRRGIIGWTVLGVVVIGAAFLRTYDFAGRPERTINDPAFERAAVAICEKEIPKLRAVRREDRSDDPLEKETAAKVDEVADDLEAMVDRLKELAVRAADRAEVDGWFAAFGDFVEAGRNYAEALRGGDENEYNRVDDQGIEPLERIQDFARANHMDACIP